MSWQSVMGLGLAFLVLLLAFAVGFRLVMRWMDAGGETQVAGQQDAAPPCGLPVVRFERVSPARGVSPAEWAEAALARAGGELPRALQYEAKLVQRAGENRARRAALRHGGEVQCGKNAGVQMLPVEFCGGARCGERGEVPVGVRVVRVVGDECGFYHWAGRSCGKGERWVFRYFHG